MYASCHRLKVVPLSTMRPISTLKFSTLVNSQTFLTQYTYIKRKETL